jgi:bacterial/archaeal transporter family protein
MAWLLPTLGYIFALGVWGIASKLALRTLSWEDVMVATALVYALAALLLMSTGRGGIHLDRDFGWALGAGLCGVIAVFCFYAALGSGRDVSTIVGVSAAYPAVTLILAALFLDDGITLAKVAGVSLVIGGVVLLSLKG